MERQWIQPPWASRPAGPYQEPPTLQLCETLALKGLCIGPWKGMSMRPWSMPQALKLLSHFPHLQESSVTHLPPLPRSPKASRLWAQAQEESGSGSHDHVLAQSRSWCLHGSAHTQECLLRKEVWWKVVKNTETTQEGKSAQKTKKLFFLLFEIRAPL